MEYTASCLVCFCLTTFHKALYHMQDMSVRICMQHVEFMYHYIVALGIALLNKAST